MKNLRFGLVMIFIALFTESALAQSRVTIALVAGDTITNTGTITRVINGPLSGGWGGLSVQVVLTKLSGTGAGTLKIQGSNDGTNYVDIGSAFTITNVATQSTIFYVTAPLPAYIRATATGSGTESVVATYIYRFSRYMNN